MCKNNPVKVEKHIWEPSTSPFERIHVDFAGPFFGKWFFMLVDSYTKWPEIHIVKNIKSHTIMKKCTEIFAVFGLPYLMISDNGSSFVSNDFRAFLKSNGIRLKLIAPYNPSTNGQAERYVQILKKSIKKMCMKNQKDIDTSLQQMLAMYRIMPHMGTNIAPAELMFKTKPRCKLDLIRPAELKRDFSYNDNLTCIFFKEGERVSCRNYIGKDKWKFGIIKKRIGKLHYLIELDDKRVWKRHINQMSKIGKNVKNKNDDEFDYYEFPDNSLDKNENVMINNDNV